MVIVHLLEQESNQVYVHVTVLHRNKFLYNKIRRCTNFTNLFWHETLHVSDSSSVHHQELIQLKNIFGANHFYKQQAGCHQHSKCSGFALYLFVVVTAVSDCSGGIY
jgi:hypothetical protein